MIKLNSTKILFLKMLKGDLKRRACEKANIDPMSFNGDTNLLTGQTVSRSEIESFSSYKLMNNDERNIVNSILNEIKTHNEVQKGKLLVKRIDSLVPITEELVDYKEAA